MFKKFISVLCMFFGILTAAHAGPAANIEYVHKMIAHVWGLEIPYNPELKNPRFAANMEYLLAAVDVANEMLNGYKTTDYKSDPKYATRYIADTLVTNKAVHELISVEYPFWMETMETDYFAFVIGAAGNYMVDWGDGTIQNIAITEQDSIDGGVLLEHNYNESGKYKVRLRGRATFYSPMHYEWNGAGGGVLFFCSYWICGTPEMVAQVGGNLPQIFPTLADGTNPSFAMLFFGTSNLNQQIPESLFYGLTGEPRDGMFYATFMNSGFTGMIPEQLFRDVRGTPAANMFAYTFRTSNLTGEIPGTLFAGLRGEVNFEENPDDAYANGPMSLFFNTFSESKFTKIGSGLFDGGGITYDANNGWEHFIDTFTDCVDLTGESAKIGDQYLYKIWSDASDPFTYTNATGLTDYPCIPTAWGGAGGTGPSCITQDDMGRFSADINITEDYRRNVGFNLRAAGRFIIDWGDGTVEEFINTEDVFDDSVAVRREHEYAEVGEYTITIAGLATQYADADSYSDSLPSAWEHTFNFYGMGSELVGVSGKIGSVFPTLADGSNPNFGGLFYGAQMETVPADLFDGIYGQASFAMFAGMFMESKIKEIPGGLFDGITGSSNRMFHGFCELCMNLDTVSGDVFKFANDLEPTSSMFQGVFNQSSLKGIPAGLFDDVVGEAAEQMFFRAFKSCSELTGEIPAGLFAGISGTPKNDMFRETFSGDSGLTGEIPDDLFGNISGTLPQWDSFSSMFAGCTGLTGMSAKIDGTLLYEIWPDATSSQVGSMYSGCTGLTDYPCIPTIWGGLGTDTDCKIENVIVESTTRPDVAEWPFEMKTVDLDAGGSIGIGLALVGDVYIDWGDGNYTTINMMGDYQSEDIVHEYATAGEYTIKIAANPRKYFSGMDWTTFYVWPSESLASIDGSLGRVFPTLSNGSNPCFAYAFEGAVNLTGEIPADLFDGIHGQPNDWMYAGVFFDTGISGTIPAGLFGDLSGEWTEGLFESVFAGCTGLTGEIPADLFAGLTGDLPDYVFNYAFEYCSGLTGPSAKIGNKYLYEIWPDATEDQVGYMYIEATGLSDWCQIPSLWRGADPLCDSDAEFAVYVETPSANSTFGFRLGAAGEFTVDWGDGNVETIVKDNTDSVNYTHTYANAGDYVFGISGQATAYPTDFSDYYGGDTGAAIAFGARSIVGADYIYNIRGSLGHVFGTLADGSQPRFLNLFRGAKQMTIVVPENLFDGIYGQPVSHMFQYAFYLSGIKGVMGPLFAGISGTPTNSLYQWTFSGCDELSLPLPDGMFGNLTGDLGSYTFGNTFLHSNNMTGSSACDANGRYLYEVWPDATWGQVEGMYCNDSQYTDMDSIPIAWTGCPLS